MLIAPGTSLGGARPKANFTDADGSLWLAKFPAKDDRYDVGAWELVARNLAQRAGIWMSEARGMRLTDRPARPADGAWHRPTTSIRTRTRTPTASRSTAKPRSPTSTPLWPAPTCTASANAGPRRYQPKSTPPLQAGATRPQSRVWGASKGLAWSVSSPHEGVACDAQPARPFAMDKLETCASPRFFVNAIDVSNARIPRFVQTFVFPTGFPSRGHR
jgi:hypothetical protein